MSRPSRSTHPPSRTFALATVEAVVLFGLYLMFTGSHDAHECVGGGVCAIVGALASHVVRRERIARFAAYGRWLRQAAKLPLDVMTGTAEILGVLVRQLRGRPAPSLLMETPFEVGAGDDASASTRRALAVALTTITPTSVVLGIDRARKGLVFHQIARSAVPEMTRRLGAKP